MAAIAGRLGEIWTNSGASTAITKEACEAVATTIYHVTAAAKRYLDPATAVLVYDNDVLQTSGYHIAGGCQVHFDSAPTTPVTLTGAYFAPAEVSLCQSWSIDLQSELYETSSLGGGATTWVGSGIINWTGSFERFHEDDTWGAKVFANGTQHYVRLFTDQPSGLCWTGWITSTGWGLNVPLELEKETFSFQGVGEPVYTTDET